MMLFVFHVDRGTMMTFNMQAALYTVGELKERIYQLCNIPPEKQVLLVSGGRGLYSENKVCSYLGGTDSNPIFLFYKYGIADELQLPEDSMHKSESEILSKVQEAVRDPEMTHAVVARRATLAQQLYDIAEEYLSQCKSLVLDQHLQQQGWMAVVANLEDTTLEFKQRADSYEDTFNHYYSSYGEYIHLVKGFNEDLKLLSKIPLLPALLSEKDLTDRDDEDGSNDEEELAMEAVKPKSLLEYITSSENNQQMEQLFDMCTTGLQQFDEKVHNRMRNDIAEVLALADDPEMKEVKGIGERLYGLDKLIREAESCVLEQKQQTTSFTLNNLTIARTGEKSIIPDLCSSHTVQLQAMGNNHQKLCDFRRRVIKAKEELSGNLFLRLKWVMYVENKILETSQKLFVCHENLKRLCRQLDMLHQIHNAPTLYLNGISEVVRRKAFSKAFLLWASDLACRMMTIHNDEKARRKDFAAAAEGHFLATLFPDSSDTIPAFAVEPPSVFDSNLPALSEEDVQTFKDSLPLALRDEFKLYDLSTVMEFFTVKEGKSDFVQAGSQTMEVCEHPDFSATIQNVPKIMDSEQCLGVATIPFLKDLDKGCESETDTEEFEKVCQSPLELQFDREVLSVPRTQDIGTLTEVGERCQVPPKKPPRAIQKHPLIVQQVVSFDHSSLSTHNLQRALSYSGSNTTDSFTNIKNPSLESIDELSSLKNFSSNLDSCYNSHHHLQHNLQSSNNTLLRSKSLSPHTPLSPRDAQQGDHLSLSSPVQSHQQVVGEFVTDEFYIDESLPSSLSLEAGQCQGEYAKQLDTAHNVVALLQDNLQTSRTEYDRVKGSLTQLSSVTQQALVNLRRELSDLKEFFITEKGVLAKHCGDLTESWEQVSSGNDVKDKQIAILISDHDELLKNFKRELDMKNEELKCLRTENDSLDQQNKNFYMDNCYLKSEIDSIKTQSLMEMENLRRSLVEKDIEKERSVQLLKEEFKTELNTLRSRFKLMTESSPTDPTLEKREQIWVEMETQREKQIQAAILSEREKWEKIIENINVTNENLIREKQFLTIDNEEKDNLIKHLRNEVEQLRRMQKEPDVVECRVDELNASVVGVSEASRAEATDPTNLKDSLTTSQLSLIKSKKLSVTKCNIGDLVLVLWDPKHNNFKILQESSTMYFLHSDSLNILGLRRGDESKLYTWGEVTHKDYCHARKAQNRYNVQVGTKFYRVKVKPVLSDNLTVEDKKEEEEPKDAGKEEGKDLPVQTSVVESTNPSERSGTDHTNTPASSTRSSSVMTCSFSIHSPEPLQMDTSTSSNRTHTFTYCLTDPWIGGSAWIENS